MKKLNSKLTVFFLLITFSIAATDKHFLDSVKGVLDTTTNIKAKLNCLYTLSFEYGQLNPRKGIEYGKECLKLAEKTNNLRSQLNAFNGLGNAYETLANYDSALWFHLKSYELATKTNSRFNMAATIFNVGNCLKQKGDYRAALKYYLQAYDLVRNKEDYNPRIHYQLGDLYLKLGKIEEAQKHAIMGFDKSMKRKEDYVAYTMNILMSKCYISLNQPDTAEIILNNTLKNLRKNIDQVSLCMCLDVLGEIMIEKKKFQKAINYFNEELTLQKEINNKNGITASSLNLASCFVQLPTNDKLAISYLDTAIAYIPYIKANKEELSSSYHKISDIYYKMGMFRQAYENQKLYEELDHSLLNKEKYYQLNELQTKYELEKHQIEIQHQKMELTSQASVLERKKLQLIFIVIAFILLLITGFFWYRWYSIKQKLLIEVELQKQEQLRESAIKEKETEERTRIAKDIHDELGSGISKIFLLAEYSKNLDNIEIVRENIRTVSKTAESLSENMKDLVWSLNPHNSTLDQLITRINEFSSEFLEPFPIRKNFECPDLIPDKKISQEAQRNIFMIFKESLNNAVKHSGCNTIKIKVLIAENLLTISLSDNGRGFDISNTNKKGNGLSNMVTRMKAIGGKLDIFSDEKGTTVSIIYNF